MSDDIERLEKLIADDWQAISNVGDEVDGFTVVELIEENEGRWHMWTRVIVQSGDTGNYYGYKFGRGLTEYQEDQDPLPNSVAQMVKRVEMVEVWDKKRV